MIWQLSWREWHELVPNASGLTTLAYEPSVAVGFVFPAGMAHKAGHSCDLDRRVMSREQVVYGTLSVSGVFKTLELGDDQVILLMSS